LNANDKILDLLTKHNVDLQRYGNATVRRIISLLNRAESDILGQIVLADPEGKTIERLEQLISAIKTINANAADQIERAMRSEIQDLAEYEATYASNLLRTSIPVRFDVITPAAGQIAAATLSRPFQGRLLREWISGLSDGTQARVRDAIRLGVVEGETTDQIVRRIRGTRANAYKDGIYETSRRSAETMVRTALNHTANYAREETYKAQGSLIKSVQWVSTLDLRTTEICMARDGKIYPLGEGPRPPAHFGCRSTTTPVTASWKELGFDIDEVPPAERASMNGQVAADLTYPEWLKRQPREVIEEALGKTKAKLFIEGGLTIDRFVNNQGVTLTLDELRARDAAAFKRAGL
jgi:SPP1 gp7 family putative phage head morphogenesis protein